MKRVNKIVLYGLMLFFVASCMSAEDIKEREKLEAANNIVIVKPIKPTNLGSIIKVEAATFYQKTEKKIGTIVDVRTVEEFTTSHIKGAVNIDFKKRDFPDFINALDKEKPVLIYCNSANRSGKAALIMQSLGFKEVIDLDGGFNAWNKDSMEIVTENNEANIKLQETLAKEELKGTPIAGISHQIEVDEFNELLKANKVTIVDVRTPGEFAEGHIEGAINVDWKNRNFAENILQVTDEKPAAIYCGSGNRATRAMFAMGAIGFQEIYNLKNGFDAWKEAEMPLKTLEVKGDIRHLDNTNFNNAILSQVGSLIDVRTPSEHADYHIPGAGNIDYKNDNFETECAKLDKEIPVLIYCRTGIRSGKAMKIMEGLGFKVYNLDNGIKHWKSQGMKVEGNNVSKPVSGGEEGC